MLKRIKVLFNHNHPNSPSSSPHPEKPHNNSPDPTTKPPPTPPLVKKEDKAPSSSSSASSNDAITPTSSPVQPTGTPDLSFITSADTSPTPVTPGNTMLEGHAESTYNHQHRDNSLFPAPGHKEDGSPKTPVPHLPDLKGYILMEKLGDGAFSQVYRAKELATGLEVAIKVVTKSQLNPAQRTNILKEVTITRQLRHRNIVQMRAFFDTPEHFYLVLEVIPGGELFHRIVRLTYFSEPLARHVALQIGEAIRFLHLERGVVHRDIKPENLLFDPIPLIPSSPSANTGQEAKVDEGKFCPGQGGGGIGRVVLADFGLSKVVWAEDTATPCGTVGYTAPEIVRDERYSTGVDMWALGCVLYTMLCGFPPFYDENVRQLTEKVARGQYTFLSPWWDDISPEAKDLVSHLLEVDPAKRYSITQFLEHPWCQGMERGQPCPIPVSGSIAGSTPTSSRKPQQVAMGSTPEMEDQIFHTPDTLVVGSPSPALNIPKRRAIPGSPATPLGEGTHAAGGGDLVMKAALELAYSEQRHREDAWCKERVRNQRKAAATKAPGGSGTGGDGPSRGTSNLRSTWMAASTSSEDDDTDVEDDIVEIGIAGKDEPVDVGYAEAHASQLSFADISKSPKRRVMRDEDQDERKLELQRTQCVESSQTTITNVSRRKKRNASGASAGSNTNGSSFELNMDASMLLARRRQHGVASGA